jgi:hypothetical protein
MGAALAIAATVAHSAGARFDDEALPVGGVMTTLGPLAVLVLRGARSHATSERIAIPRMTFTCLL